MSMVVTSIKQAESNILRFEDELDNCEELQARLSYARAWYAHRDLDGNWHLAPSKFAGYVNMTAAEYIDDQPRDGRRTEKQLQMWFTEIPANHPLGEKLSEKLYQFVEAYGKAPSSKSRINVSNQFWEEYNSDNPGPPDSQLAELLIAVAQRLPNKYKDQIRSAL